MKQSGSSWFETIRRLLEPEDSTERHHGRKGPVEWAGSIQCNDSPNRGWMKTVFWMAAALGASIALAQLH